MLILILILGVLLFTIYPVIYEIYLNFKLKQKSWLRLPSFRTVFFLYLLFVLGMSWLWIRWDVPWIYPQTEEGGLLQNQEISSAISPDEREIRLAIDPALVKKEELALYQHEVFNDSEVYAAFDGANLEVYLLLEEDLRSGDHLALEAEGIEKAEWEVPDASQLKEMNGQKLTERFEERFSAPIFCQLSYHWDESVSLNRISLILTIRKKTLYGYADHVYRFELHIGTEPLMVEAMPKSRTSVIQLPY